MRADQSGLHHLRRVVVQADVVEGELERLPGRLDEARDLVRDVERRLPAVGEGMDLDQGFSLAAALPFRLRFYGLAG
jgi:hypothetical protein